jgi:hypothetical protein
MDLQELSGTNYKLLAEALEESNESLQEDNDRLRNTSRILRKVVSTLRRKLEETMSHSDELMVALDSQTEESLAHQEQADMLMLELYAATPIEGEYIEEVTKLPWSPIDVEALKQLRKNSSY